MHFENGGQSASIHVKPTQWKLTENSPSEVIHALGRVTISYDYVLPQMNLKNSQNTNINCCIGGKI